MSDATVEAYRKRRQQRLDAKSEEQRKTIERYYQRRWDRLDARGYSLNEKMAITDGKGKPVAKSLAHPASCGKIRVDADDDDIGWMRIGKNSQAVPIRPGQSKKEAAKKFIKGKESEKEATNFSIKGKGTKEGTEKKRAVSSNNPQSKGAGNSKAIQKATATAESLGAIADYAHFAAETANTVNSALAETKDLLPDLKLPNVGTPEDCKQMIADGELKRINENPLFDIATPEMKQKVAEENAELAAEKIAKHAKDNDPMMFYNSDTNSIFIPTHNAEDYQEMERVAQIAKLHEHLAVGSVKGLVDHEVGHGIDAQLGISKLPEVRNYYESLNERDIESGLSKYGCKNVGEFVAEGWSEYRNSGNPRPMAKRIGETVMREYAGRNNNPPPELVYG